MSTFDVNDLEGQGQLTLYSIEGPKLHRRTEVTTTPHRPLRLRGKHDVGMNNKKSYMLCTWIRQLDMTSGFRVRFYGSYVTSAMADDVTPLIPKRFSVITQRTLSGSYIENDSFICANF